MPDRDGRDARFGLPASPRQWVSLVAGLLPLVAVAVFVLQNTDEVKVSFLFFNPRMPLGVALLVAAALGGAGAVFLSFVRRRRR